MAGVHGLKHVQRLAAADFANDDSVRAHAQGVSDKISDADLALAFDVPRTAFKPDNMFLLQLKLDGVLYRDDSLIGGNKGKTRH